MYVETQIPSSLPTPSAKPMHDHDVSAENNKVSVTDLSSTNGTYIDDEELVPLRAVEMAIGTEVTFGRDTALRETCLECNKTTRPKGRLSCCRRHVPCKIQAGGEELSCQ